MSRSQYLEIFIEEASENLQALNNLLLSMEEQGFVEDAMNDAYRVVHTIKGTAAVIGIEPITELSHVMEDLFDTLNGRSMIPSKGLMDVLFEGTDTIERMIEELESNDNTSINPTKVIEKIREQIEVDEADGSGSYSFNEGILELPALELDPIELESISKQRKEGKGIFDVSILFEESCICKEGRAYQLMEKLNRMGILVKIFPDLEEISDDHPGMRGILATMEEVDTISSDLSDIMEVSRIEVVPLNPEEVPQVFDDTIGSGEEDPAEKEIPEGPRSQGNATTGTIRVKSKLLDDLLNLVSEVMISNIRINKLAEDLESRDLQQVLKNNSRLMGALQDAVLRTRMVPVDFIFKRFPRMVRDLSQERGKEVEFTMRGNDIEIDRGLIDEIGDALVHLLRNGLDHGLESPEEREVAGKDPRGRLVLSAFQEQSNIMITIEDDGRGIDHERILAKAIANGIITMEEAERMDEKKAVGLIFKPGFSMAEKVTDISGRGVGMDVVRTKIIGLGGSVKIDSEIGKGTKFTISLPPSMAIIKAMLVRVNGEKYAIPLENVRETVKIDMRKVDSIGGSKVFRLRNEVLEVRNMNVEFEGPKVTESDLMPALIVEKNENRICLVVSQLIGQQEIVVKSLGRNIRSSGYFSGATILGDGKVALILDMGAFT